MGAVTYTEYVCDRCKMVCKNSTDTRSLTSGSCTVKYNWTEGAMAYDGAWGGISGNGEAWLCQECSKAFRSFIASSPQPSPNADAIV
jgi:hypothetical protein